MNFQSPRNHNPRILLASVVMFLISHFNLRLTILRSSSHTDTMVSAHILKSFDINLARVVSEKTSLFSFITLYVINNFHTYYIISISQHLYHDNGLYQ